MAIRPWARGALLTIIPVTVILGGSYAYMRNAFPEFYADNTVYSVAYEKPKGWTEIPPGPFTLFVFRHPENRGTLRASVNEIQSKYNPTPELDTDGIASHYVDITEENMPEWKARRMEPIKTGSEEFSLIRRSKKDKTVYTAFCSKGNTTVVVSLYAGGEAAASVDEFLPEFRKLVASFRLTPKNIVFDD